MIRRIFDRFLEETMHTKPLKKELIQILEDIVGMYVPSGHEDEIIAYSMTVLKKNGFDVKLDVTKNVIASRGKLGEGDKLVCINAHTDTVQKESDKIIADVVFYDWIKDAFHTNGRAMIGGDDKCGIALALTLAAHTDLPMKIILTSGEEVGSIGAEALDEKEFDDVAFTFTIDRMHGDDLISEYCGLVLAPDTFVQKFIQMSKDINVDFKETFGSYADTYILCQYAPAVNLSSGYYNPHSKDDFIMVNELYSVMRAVMNAIVHRDDLNLAISQAPKGWQVNNYASRGTYISYGGYYGYGTKGHYGTASARGRARIGTRDYYGYTKEEFNGMSRKQRRKCKIDFKNRGADDKEPSKRKLPAGGESYGDLIDMYVSGDLSESDWDYLLQNGTITSDIHSEGVENKFDTRPPHQQSVDDLIEAYANGEIYDSEWDEMLEDGTLSKLEYQLGIDELISRERYASAFDKGGFNTGKIEGLDELIRDEEEKEFYDNLKKSKHPNTISKMDFQTDEGEWDSKALRDIGFSSGFLPETTEDTIFVEYVTGQLSYQDLVSDMTSHFIDRWLFENAVKARTEFVAMMIPKQEQNKWVKIDQVGRKQARISIRDKLSSFGLLSGYARGSIQDDIFIDYVGGGMSDYDLQSDVSSGLIRKEFAKTCKYSKDDYLDMMDWARRDQLDRISDIEKSKRKSKEINFLHKKQAKKPKTLRERDEYDECGDNDDCRGCGN